MSNPKCCICGKFVPCDADRLVPCGRVLDLEPPEAKFYCAACAQSSKERYIEQEWCPESYTYANWQIEVLNYLAKEE